jgi:hypothetical protein
VSTNEELEARIAAARAAATEGRALAADAQHALARRSPEQSQAIALTSIAQSLSAMATVLLATIDEDAR